MKDVILQTVDNHDFFEVKEHFRTESDNRVAGINGMSVGIVANQPAHLSGVIRYRLLNKGCPFCQVLRLLQYSVVTFVDFQASCRETAQEFGGVIRNGAKISYAFAEADIPKVTVITRKLTASLCVMSSKHLRVILTMLAHRRNCVMGQEVLPEVLYGKACPKKHRIQAHSWAEKEKEYQDVFANPYIAAQRVTLMILLNRLKPGQEYQVTGLLQKQARYNPMKKHGKYFITDAKRLSIIRRAT